MDKRYKHAFAKENIKMAKLYKMILVREMKIKHFELPQNNDNNGLY